MDRHEMIKRLGMGENPIDVSIQKWEDGKRYVESDTFDFKVVSQMLKGGDNCALCFRYVDDYWYNICSECPIYKRTGMTLCQNTPYISVVDAIHSQDKSGLIKAIDDEIEFLKSLKKEDDKNGSN